MLITIVAGARPNFMKVAPIIKSIEAARTAGNEIRYRLVHTGQHFDKKMSGEFFEQLGLPTPDLNLAAGGGSQAEQTAAILISFEKELIENRPDVVLVVGDVTSTMACTIAAKKMCLQVVHVEAGIRSGDMTMPEEINRVVTDSICDHFFTTSRTASQFLIETGTDPRRVHFVGNTMIDTLVQNLGRLQQSEVWHTHRLQARQYFLLTLHRPSNVDQVATLRAVLDAVLAGTRGLKIVFPVHPRTRKVLKEIDYCDDRLVQVDPLGYLEFIYLLKHARAVITDSGGITEEATVLDIPCMTLRNTTERPETVIQGTNELVGADPFNLSKYFDALFGGKWKKATVPELWDGRSADRIVDTLLRVYATEGGDQPECKQAIR